MNQDPMGGQNLEPTNQPPAGPQPGGWAPAPESPAAPPSPPAGSNPFETTPPPVPPVSGPMAPVGDEGMMEPGPRQSSLPLILILAVLLILGGLFLASWMGWISLGGIEQLWGGGKTEPVTPTIEPTTKPTTNINDAKRKEDLINLKTVLKKYYTATQSYPVAATMEKTLDSAALKVLVPDYIPALPVDPLSPTYYYGYKSDGKTFELTAVLEDKTDLSGMMVGDIFLYRITDSSTETPTSSTGTSATSETTSDTTNGTGDNSDLTPDITQ